jgi:hypothetical protein
LALSASALAIKAEAQGRDLSLLVGLSEPVVDRGTGISVGYVVGNPTPSPSASYRIEWFGSRDTALNADDVRLGTTESEREIIANSFQEDSVRLDSCRLEAGTWRIIGRLADVVPGDDNPENDIAVAADPLEVLPASDGPAVCGDTDPPPGLVNPGLNDAWFDRETPGQGLLLAVYPEARTVFAAWFTFDLEPASGAGNANLGAPGQRWLTAQGGWEGNRATLSVVNSTGGTFNRQDPPVDVDGDYGTMVLDVRDCGTIDLRYELPSVERSGSLTLTRVATDNVALCEALSAPPPTAQVGTGAGSRSSR